MNRAAQPPALTGPTQPAPDPQELSTLADMARAAFDKLMDPASDLDAPRAAVAHKFLGTMLDIYAMQQADQATPAQIDLAARLSGGPTINATNVQINTAPARARRQPPDTPPPNPAREVPPVVIDLDIIEDAPVLRPLPAPDPDPDPPPPDLVITSRRFNPIRARRPT